MIWWRYPLLSDMLSGKVGNPAKYNSLRTLECFLNADGQEPTTTNCEKVYGERNTVQLVTSTVELNPEVYAEEIPEVYVLD